MSQEIISGVYSITNLKNGKLYIGSSNNIYRRWRDHKNLLKKDKHHSNHLQRAWNKYGEENFIFKILEECNEDILLKREQYYIDLYVSYDNEFGYNESDIAGRPSMTLEQREKCAKMASERLRGEGSWCNVYSESQIVKLIDDLKTGEYSYNQLSNKHNISYDIVASVAGHASWKYLTDGLVFPKANKSTRENVKLNEQDVKEIINLILSGECNKKISAIYKVHPKTISDIRNHKTWTDMTNGIKFPKSQKSKAYDNKYKDEVLRLRMELGLTYNKIAEMLGISSSYVSALINK